MTTVIPVIESSLSSPRVRAVSVDRPWEWLGAGWKDLWRAPATSISYGLIFVIMGYILVYLVINRFHFALALTTGFLLAGPFLAMGLYDISRRLEAGETPSLGRALTAWRHNALPILLFGLLIGLLMIIWVRLSALLFAVIVRDLSLGNSVSELFFSGSGLTFLIVFTLVGAVVAAVVFVVSVVSIPMMLDRKIDFIMAVLTSVAAVRINTITMVTWAALIVVFTGIGLVTFYVGLAIAMPLIGHASWHAYRDLVEDGGPERLPL